MKANKLFVLFVILVLLKILITSLVISPSVFGDEYTYIKAARSLWNEGDFSVHGLPVVAHPPLYSLLISPAFAFEDMATIYFVIKIINALLSSLIIFPAFLLLKEFLSKKKSLFGAALVGLLPFSFATSAYIMSENIFYPLILFALFFLFKAFTNPHWKFGIFAGIFTTLAYGSRFFGVVLFVLIGCMLLYVMYKKEWAYVRNGILALVIGLIFPVFWFLRNKSLGSSTVMSLMENTVVSLHNEATLFSLIFMFILWVFIHFTYIILATGFIPSLIVMKKFPKQDKKQKVWLLMTAIMVFAIVLIISKRAIGLGIKEVTLLSGFVGRVIGRYIDLLLPLIVISALICLEKGKQLITKKSLYYSIGIILLGFSLWYFPLFPFNNTSLTLFGLGKVIIEYLVSRTTQFAFISPITLLILLGITIGLIYYIYKLNKKKEFSFFKVCYVLGIFFLVTSIASFGATTYTAQKWDANEQLQVSKFLSKNDFNRVVFDEEFCGFELYRDNPKVLCSSSKHLSFIGFWINKDIRVGKISKLQEGDIFITRATLKKEVIKETASGIKVYKA